MVILRVFAHLVLAGHTLHGRLGLAFALVRVIVVVVEEVLCVGHALRLHYNFPVFFEVRRRCLGVFRRCSYIGMLLFGGFGNFFDHYKLRILRSRPLVFGHHRNPVSELDRDLPYLRLFRLLTFFNFLLALCHWAGFCFIQKGT